MYLWNINKSNVPFLFSVKAVYDVTVVFRTDEDPTLHDLVKAKSCIADVACRRIPIKEIPDGEKEASDFLHQLYREKVCYDDK